MSNKIYFYANIEIDLAIISSVALIFKRSSNNFKKELILICPLTKRLMDDRMSETYSVFDKVIKIPYYEILEHIFHLPKSLYSLYMFKSSFKKIRLEENSLFFCFDAFTYTDVIVFNEAQRAKCKLIVLSAFVGKRFDKSKLSIEWHSTLVYSLFTIFLTKPVRFLNCKIKNSNLSGYKIFYGSPDYVIKIESSNSILKPKIKFFEKLPIPIPILKQEKKSDNDNRLKLLLLVSSMHASRYENYWIHVRSIIEKIPQNITIFVKDHPQAISKAELELQEFEINFVDKSENMELFILKNNIFNVMGHGSTGLITASWMGMSVYDYTNILKYKESLNTYYSEYLDMGYDIVRLSEVYELKKINFNFSPSLKKSKAILNSWKHVISEIQK